MQRAVNKSLIYDFNVLWNNILGKPLIFGNTTAEIRNAVNYSSLIKYSNTSWILNNQDYNDSSEMQLATNDSTLVYDIDVLWDNLDGHPTVFGNTTAEIQSAMNYSSIIKYTNTSWLLLNQGYNTSRQMQIAINDSFMTYNFGVLWTNVVGRPTNLGNTTAQIRDAGNYSSTIRYSNTSWILSNQGYNTSAQMRNVIQSANLNISIYNITATNFIGNGSLLTGIYNTSAQMKAAVNYTNLLKYDGNTNNLYMGNYNISVDIGHKFCLMANCSSYFWNNGTYMVIY
jgi:uncharacterized protein YegP (UPF0339 family)